MVDAGTDEFAGAPAVVASSDVNSETVCVTAVIKLNKNWKLY
jgi:hypothetical protein